MQLIIRLNNILVDLLEPPPLKTILLGRRIGFPELVTGDWATNYVATIKKKRTLSEQMTMFDLTCNTRPVIGPKTSAN